MEPPAVGVAARIAEAQPDCFAQLLAGCAGRPAAAQTCVNIESKRRLSLSKAALGFDKLSPRPCSINKFMETIVCDLCGQAESDPNRQLTDRFTGDAFTLVRCQTCQLIYLNPRPTEAEMGRYYPTASEPHAVG